MEITRCKPAGFGSFSGSELGVAGLGQRRADLEAEIVEIELLAGRDVFAGGLTIASLVLLAVLLSLGS